MKISENERGLIVATIGLALVGFFYTRSIHKEIAHAEVIEQELKDYAESIKPFFDLALASKSFAIYNVDKNEFVYKKNAEQVLPLASLAKVMSVVVALENVPQDHIFKIEKDSLSLAGDNGLLVDEKWRRDDLLKYTLVVSSNDAIHQVAMETGKIISPNTENPEQVFIDKMNEKARELKLNSLKFYNESGLDLIENGETKNGAYASARDMARLFAYAIENYPDIFSLTTQKEATITSFDKEHTGTNTNPFVGEIDGLIASKTGFTNISGGNLTVAVKDKKGEKMVVVVLGSTFDERFSDVKSISSILSQNNVK
ncbi:MAG: D-alanyl-D-alanine carboxypeptidase [Bacteroidetes bacterium]|nr:D-alanyl-D-alanine carboxypeptidase [Bacteroidota bacterium]